MLNRRTFTALIGGAFAVARNARAQSATGKTVFYSAVGPELTLYDIDIAGAALTKHGSVMLPGNVQYAWPHPTRRYFYVVSSNGEPGGGDAPKGNIHVLNAFEINPASGALKPLGTAQNLPSRPIHVSVDRAGEYVLTAYNDPSNVTVHRLNRDGSVGPLVVQPEKLDTGIYGHQIRTTPSNQTAILVTRGNNATANKPEDPGAIKVFSFKDGVLRNLQSIAPGNGLGFGPRHLDFHPTKPWVFVSIERQNQLYVYELKSDGTLGTQPMFVKQTLMDPRNVRPSQGAGTIHIHPNGRFVYLTNRNAGTVDFQGKKVFGGGENNVAAFSIDQNSAEPTLQETAEGHGIQLRTFALDPTARLLVAASIQPLLLRKNEGTELLPAGLSVYRIGDNGKLTFVRKYDIDAAKGTQFWSGMVTLA